MNEVFVVGQYILNTSLGIVWEIQGVFSSREKAEMACVKDSYFVGPLMMDQEFPENSHEWIGCYYPRIQGSRL